MSEGNMSHYANCPYCGEPVAGFAWEIQCTCPGAVVAMNAPKQRPDELLMKLHDYWQNDKLEEWTEHHQTIDALKLGAEAIRGNERLRVFPSANTEDTINAARHVDWQQVICHQGEPCFHLEYGQFCLRARYWAGHSDSCEGGDHAFVPLDVAITGMVSIDAVHLRTELTEARATIETLQKEISDSAEDIDCLRSRKAEGEGYSALAVIDRDNRIRALNKRIAELEAELANKTKETES